jgi:hypothetical protein
LLGKTLANMDKRALLTVLPPGHPLKGQKV